MPDCCSGHQTHNQLILTSLRESIVDKPPYISGTLQLPNSFFSLFYTVARDGNAARFEGDPLNSHSERAFADISCVQTHKFC